MDDNAGAGFTLTRLTADREVCARIFEQVCILQPELYLKQPAKDRFWSLVRDLMTKLERAKYHSDRCSQVAHAAIAGVTAIPGSAAMHADLTTGVEAEVEAFLLQAKSTLDLLSKILEPTVGITLGSFGDKGGRLIKALNRNVPRDRLERAGTLVRLIEHDRGWLTQMIELRDGIAHSHALRSSGLRTQTRGAQLLVGEPVDDAGTPYPSLVATLYFNILTFAEDFVALALNVAMAPALAVQIVDPSPDRSPMSKKYGLALSGPGSG